MKVLLNNLYITNPDAYARLEGNTICVEVDKQKVLQVPLHHIGSVVCFGDVIMTPALMQKLVSEGKSVNYLTRNGEFAARIEGPTSGNVLLRIDQYKKLADEKFNLECCRGIVSGKIFNSRQLLVRGAREAANSESTERLQRAADMLASLLRKLPNTTDVNVLRGLEGEAARVYFDSINLMIAPRYRELMAMHGRSRRPPKDRLNSLLSFLYTILLNDCRAALESVGLDSQAGYLHTLRPGRPSLALDLMEEFRSILGDRLALTLINRAQVGSEDFEFKPGGAVFIESKVRKEIIAAYQKRKQEEITHPLTDEKMPIGLIIYFQARILARVIRSDMDQYLPFLYK